MDSERVKHVVGDWEMKWGLIYVSSIIDKLPSPGHFVKILDDEGSEYETKMHSQHARIDGLTKWYRNHPNIKVGDAVYFEIISNDTLLISSTAFLDKLFDEIDYYSTKDDFSEGESRIVIHIKKERNQKLVKLAKEKWSAQHNHDIKCIVCSFSFYKTYGRIGQGFIEAHHVVPLSKLDGSITIKTEDLVPVCANCHRILHRKDPLLTMDELHQIIEMNESTIEI